MWCREFIQGKTNSMKWKPTLLKTERKVWLTLGTVEWFASILTNTVTFRRKYSEWYGINSSRSPCLNSNTHFRWPKTFNHGESKVTARKRCSFHREDIHSSVKVRDNVCLVYHSITKSLHISSDKKMLKKDLGKVTKVKSVK
jgi:hypothetical protein